MQGDTAAGVVVVDVDGQMEVADIVAEVVCMPVAVEGGVLVDGPDAKAEVEVHCLSR